MNKSPLSATKFKLLFLACWLIIIADHAMVLHFFGLSWKVAIIDSLISNSILLLFSLLIMNTLRYYLPRGSQYIHIFFTSIFLNISWLLLTKLILKLFLHKNEGYEELLQNSLSIRFSIAFLLLGCVTLISILWYNQQEQKENETKQIDADKLAKEAELFKLRQQLQPHFLFNSLNSINALIGTRPKEARKMVQQLSDFLRGTIKKEELQWVTFQEELQYLELYLDIEKVRFGNRLTTNVAIDEGLELLQIPALLLQPVVENAIKFGLYDTVGDTAITLYAAKQGNNLVISVSNPFDAETSTPKQGIGFGLQSIQRRLYLLFGRTDLLITKAEDNIFTTTIQVPQVTGPQ